jgi:two-component system nitrogen regulation response regulator GlnG
MKLRLAISLTHGLRLGHQWSMPDRGSQSRADTLSTHSEQLLDRAIQRFPCLTIAHHADAARVGERAFIGHLVARPVQISRIEPLFAQRRDTSRGSGAGAALADPHISREPITLSWRAEGVEIAPPPGYKRLVVNGDAVEGSWQGSADDIAAGVVIELGKRVALVLHLASHREPPPALEMVGESDAIDEIRQAILRVADLRVSVLIRGETGVGKEHVAEALHSVSPRCARPWVAINMAAVTPSTAASELFGHVKGAFTGATSDHHGLFIRADGGTLFLDEVGEIPDSVQPMLLRALETGEAQPLGAERGQTVDTRVIAATDADLLSPDARPFRPALFHRLAGYQILVPPLRRRREDIGPLLVHFLREALQEIGQVGLLEGAPDGRPWLALELASRLLRFDWPGNVRQLKNVARQIVISSRGEPFARADRALEQLLSETADADAGALASPAPDVEAAQPSERRDPDDVGEAELIAVLREHDWEVRPTAAALGVPRSSLYGLMRKSSSIRAASDIGDDELRREHAAHGGDVVAMARALCVSRRGLQLRLRGLELDASS